MRLIDADAVKQKYRDIFIKSLVDKDRGIDLSEYAEEPSKSFNRFIDKIPTVDVFDKIRAEIKKEYEENAGWCGDNDLYTLGLKKALEIIDRHNFWSE